MAPPSSHPTSDAVCVMDASGHLGSTLVRRLLSRGYTVHAALQPLHHDKGFDEDEDYKNNKNLKIFHSDPFDFHSIMDAVAGCAGLFYTFEPPNDHSTYDESMVEVEVRAAHNVVEACAQTHTIQKLVFTSSISAVIWRDHRDSVSSFLDETHWTDINLCRKYKLWHGLSKAVAEKTAWALAMDRGVNMVCVNPGLIVTPHRSLSNTHPYLRGAAEMYEDGVLVTVDIDYLVRAHIFVYEDVSTYGRYLCFNHSITSHSDAVKLAQTLTSPATTPPPQSYGHDDRKIQQKISNKKLNKLMMDFEYGTEEH